MPPRTKIPKELIIKTAYDITKANGIESVTAKAISKQLNCSIQPIYWVFDTMDNLRNAIIHEAIKEYNNYLFCRKFRICQNIKQQGGIIFDLQRSNRIYLSCFL